MTILQDLGINSPSVIPKDVATRWTTLFNLLTTLLGYRVGLELYWARYNHIGLSNEQWELITHMVAILAPVTDATLIFETAGMEFFRLQKLFHHFMITFRKFSSGNYSSG